MHIVCLLVCLFVCLFVCSFVCYCCFCPLLQLLYLTAIRPPGRKDVNKLIDWLIDGQTQTDILQRHSIGITGCDASSVLTATGQFNGRWLTLTPTESKPLSRLQQNSAQLITSASGPPKPNLVQIHLLDITFLWLFYLYLFSKTCLHVRPACATKYLHHLGTGVAYQKQRLGPTLEGIWSRGASKKFGTPYLFWQPLKLATSNLVCNLGFGAAYQETLGSIEKYFGPPTYFCNRLS